MSDESTTMTTPSTGVSGAGAGEGALERHAAVRQKQGSVQVVVLQIRPHLCWSQRLVEKALRDRLYVPYTVDFVFELEQH